jgi:hypothetical protein
MQWRMEELMPEWDHREVHKRWMAASPEAVWDALWELRVRDLSVTTALARLRGGPSAWRRGGGADAGDHGDMRVMDAMPPRLLVADRPHEMVLTDVARYTATKPTHPPERDWTPEDFAAYSEPGWSKVAMNFRLDAAKGGTELTTETRVVSTDAATKRAFSGYWLLVRIGSGMIRRDILRAVGKAVR